MASAYKWRVSGNTYAYLVNKNGTAPIITDGYTIDDEVKVANIVNGYDGSTYATKYQALKSAMASNPDTANITMLSYKYYYDVDDSVCGFSQEGVGPQGLRGETGEQGEQGEKGEDGVGITSISAVAITGGTRVIIYLSDGSSTQFDVANGQDGTIPLIDYDLIVNNVVSGVSGNVITTTTDSVIAQLNSYYDNTITNIEDMLQDATNRLSGLTDSVVSIMAFIDANTGAISALTEGLNVANSSITSIGLAVDVLQGSVMLSSQTIDVLESAMTWAAEYMDTLSGNIGETMQRLDAVSGLVSSYTSNYDALANNYTRTVAELTTGTDEGGTAIVSLSQIFQSSNMISAVTTNSEGLSAGLILAINDGESTAKISADKIILEGDLIAQAITGTSITLASGKTATTHFDGSNGSGYLAGGSIEWDGEGNLQVKNNAYIHNVEIDNAHIHDVEINNAEIENVLISAATISAVTISAATVDDTVLNRVIVNGYINMPWVDVTEAGYWGMDHYPMATNYVYRTYYPDDTKLTEVLTWDMKDNGRIINIGNFAIGDYSENYAHITSPSGKYFYEYGSKIENGIYLSREIVTLIGFGQGSTFYGYIVLNRIDVTTGSIYGKNAKELLVLRYDVSVPNCFYCTSVSSTQPSLQKVETGKYTLTLPTEWNNHIGPSNNILIAPFVTGYGKDANDHLYYASVGNIRYSNGYKIDIYTTANGQAADGGFFLRLENLNTMAYNLSQETWVPLTA